GAGLGAGGGGAGEPLEPAARTPLFASCFDWHSSVHNHWALARARPLLEGPLAEAADRALVFAPERVEAERAHLEANPGFELPYGLAWLWTLGAAAPRLAPLVPIAGQRLGASAHPLA